MDLGFALSLAGIAIVIAGVIYFFVLPDENEVQQPVESPEEGGEEDSPVDEPKEPIDRPIEQPDGPVGPGNPIPKVSETEPELVENLDIPSRAKNTLLENNLKTVAEIRYLDGSLEEVEGIGDSYAEDIRRAIREE